MADLIVDSHIIASLRNRTNTLDAISELIDNGGDARATEFELTIDKTGVVATDNGGGLDDLNLLFKPGASKSKMQTSAIGRYGIGAKEAMLHFGSHVIVESVCKGKYRRYAINWNEIEQKGTPTPHDGHVLPIRRAPAEIAGGGTSVTITDLSLGRSRIYPDVLAKRLSHRYRPGIRKGKSYFVTFADGERRQLTADAEALGLWKTEREIMGAAADRPFTLRYTDLKEYDLNLTGIHVGCGDRFIEHIKKLDGKTLPPLFYAEVMLSSKWKDCLSANKTSLIRFRDELETELSNLLSDWIKQLEAHSDEARIEKLNLLLQKHTADIFIFKRGTGQSRPDKEVTTTGPHDGDGPIDPDPSKKEHEAIHDKDGDGEKQRRRRRPSGLHFKRNDQLGNLPFELETDLNNHQITILLNGSIRAIDIAYRVPYKIPALWPLISVAFAGWIRENIKYVDEYLPGFFDMLRAAEYDIDAEKPNDVELYVTHWMMEQHPPSAQELQKTEDAA